MARITVRLRFLTGLKREIFSNARLCGTWDGSGLPVSSGTLDLSLPGNTLLVFARS